MDKLKELLSKCKCGVYVKVNAHKDYYDSPEKKIEELDLLEMTDDLDDEVRAKMIAMNNIVEVQFYPNTPIGFFNVVHYDLDIALDEALKSFDT